MIESEDAKNVVKVLSKNLAGVANDTENFKKLPDSYWGYYARGHDSKGKFGIIVTYSEDSSDVDDLIKTYEKWIADNKSKKS